jgi:hypothetical protein
MNMVRFRDSTDTSTLFDFTAPAKLLVNGSLAPVFDSVIRRNIRNNAKDILHKKGIKNRQFRFNIQLSGANRFTNLTTLTSLAENQTTIFLDTESLYDTYNGLYEFIGRFDHEIDESFSVIRVTFQLIENAN